MYIHFDITQQFYNMPTIGIISSCWTIKYFPCKILLPVLGQPSLSFFSEKSDLTKVGISEQSSKSKTPH